MKKFKAIILGAGYRGRAYADYAAAHPDQLEIVAVADPKQAESIPARAYFADWRACLDSAPEADLAVVSLPDALHQEAALTALDAGYHLLLEKPIACTEKGCRDVIARAEAKGRLVIVGHVLRYTATYAHVKAIIDSGELGELVSIAHQESIGYHKFAHSFVRGNLARSETSSPIILSKCSHDFDLFAWWFGARHCKRVASFGSILLFHGEKKPVGAGARCLDCPAAIERSCIWSARKMYLESDELKYLFADSSDEAMARIIAETDYGKCVFSSENDVPDHQAVMLEFEGGGTVSHTMTGFTRENVRTTCLAFTRGQIIVNGEDLEITRFDGGSVLTGVPADLSVPNPSRHGGGDFNLVSEMIRLLVRNNPDEIRETTRAALQSHLICFAAENSRLNRGAVVEIN